MHSLIKMHLKLFGNVRKMLKKCPLYILSFYVFTKLFHEKPTVFVAYVKRKNWCCKTFCETLFCPFLQMPHKISIFRETTLYTQIMSRFIHEILFPNFLIFRNMFFKYPVHMQGPKLMANPSKL